ncbi:MAG: hypothetical protein HAW61_02430 [Candidatus Portiera sp.]|nr:hypothetical protein [Portiera sp.]
MKIFSLSAIQKSGYFLIIALISLGFGISSPWTGLHHLAAGFLFAAVVVSICLHYRKKKSSELIEAMGTLSGIGLTFVGLVLALFNLKLGDSTEIRDSILGLLNGIYPAFFSSIAGILVALSTNWFSGFWKMDNAIEVLPEDMDIDNQILHELKNITKGQGELNKSFESFAEKMAENNMNALKEVINDFNNKLQEQFGENFKQLNEAVKALVDWQENYKIIVEETQTNLKQMNNSLKNSNKAIQEVSGVMGSIKGHADAFNEISGKINNTLNDLESAMDKNKEAAGAFIQFGDRLEGVPRKIQEGITESNNKALENLSQNLGGISEKLVEDYRKVQKAIERIKEIHKDN